jgi:hypothetical protein
MTLPGTNGRPRRFALHVEPNGSDAYGLRLEEGVGPSGEVALRVRTDADVTRRVLESVIAAVRESRIPKTALSPQRRKPLQLEQSAGVRLALVLLATAPLTKGSRVTAIEHGVAAMSTEEAYYWYAKCVGIDSGRAIRALRLLLARE